MTLKVFINSLIENIPEKHLPEELDLVLDGGAFNGMYMLGGLFYIKELEQREKIKVKRISGCSIGAILGLLFILDKMDVAIEYSKHAYKYLRKHQNLKKTFEFLKVKFYEIVKEEDLQLINKKYYLTFFDTNKCKQIIKKTYKSREDLLDCILKSCYVPYLIEKKLTDQDGCIDGAFPYIFKSKERKRKILFFNLLSINKIKNMIFIKDEKNIYPRLLEGLMDTHTFFEKNKANNMCSYVNDWNIIDILLFRLREIITIIIIYIFRLGLKIDYLFPESWKKDPFMLHHLNVFKNIWRDIMLYITV
jgi:hypothetical protein